jgi:hypothetical protein
MFQEPTHSDNQPAKPFSHQLLHHTSHPPFHTQPNQEPSLSHTFQPHLDTKPYTIPLNKPHQETQLPTLKPSPAVDTLALQLMRPSLNKPAKDQSLNHSTPTHTDKPPPLLMTPSPPHTDQLLPTSVKPDIQEPPNPLLNQLFIPHQETPLPKLPEPPMDTRFLTTVSQAQYPTPTH